MPRGDSESRPNLREMTEGEQAISPEGKSQTEIFREAEQKTREEAEKLDRRNELLEREMDTLDESRFGEDFATMSMEEKMKLDKEKHWTMRDMAANEAAKQEKLAAQTRAFLPERFSQTGEVITADIPDVGFGRFVVDGFDEGSGEYTLKREADVRKEQAGELEEGEELEEIKVDRLAVETGVSGKDMPVRRGDYLGEAGLVQEVQGDRVIVSGSNESIPLRDVQRQIEAKLMEARSREKKAQDARQAEENSKETIVDIVKRQKEQEMAETRERLKSIGEEAA